MLKREPRAWRRVGAAFACATAGLVVHDVEEFGALSADWPVTVVVLPLALALAWWFWPGRAATGLIGAWFALNVVGAVVSVLPLAALPFVPAQTVAHYAAHVAYAVGAGCAVALVCWTARIPLHGPRDSRVVERQ